jgi:hypothetical protein
MLTLCKNDQFSVSEDDKMQWNAVHPESRALLSSWRALNGLDGADRRAEAHSRDAAGLIDRLFMAQRVAEGVFVFKTVGSELRAWAGRDLRDQEVGTLFSGADKVLVRALLERSLEAPGPSVARGTAHSAGADGRMEIEFVFLPLLEKAGSERVLGLFQPITQRANAARPVLRFTLNALMMPAEPEAPARPNLRLVSNRDG